MNFGPLFDGLSWLGASLQRSLTFILSVISSLTFATPSIQPKSNAATPTSPPVASSAVALVPPSVCPPSPPATEQPSLPSSSHQDVPAPQPVGETTITSTTTATSATSSSSSSTAATTEEIEFTVCETTSPPMSPPMDSCSKAHLSPRFDSSLSPRMSPTAQILASVLSTNCSQAPGLTSKFNSQTATKLVEKLNDFSFGGSTEPVSGESTDTTTTNLEQSFPSDPLASMSERSLADIVEANKSFKVNEAILAMCRPDDKDEDGPEVMITDRIVKGEDDEGNKTINQYSVLRTLGRGRYGKVKLVIHNQTEKLLAIKIMNKSLLQTLSARGKEGMMRSTMREVAIMKKLRHPNLVTLHEVIDDIERGKLYLVIDYVEKGAVGEMKSDGSLKKGPLSEEVLTGYLHQLIAGLSYLHRQRIIHRDIKPENILLAKDGTIRIADFGVSTFEEEAAKYNAGTPAFLAPEVVRGDPDINWRAVDVWAVGVTAFILLYDKLPFDGKGRDGLEASIKEDPVKIPQNSPPSTRAFFKSVLDKNPATRMTLDEMGNHPFVTNGGRHPSVQTDTSAPVEADEAEASKAVLTARNVRLIDYVMLTVKIKGQMRKIRSVIANRRNSAASEASVNTDLCPMLLEDPLSIDGVRRDSVASVTSMQSTERHSPNFLTANYGEGPSGSPPKSRSPASPKSHSPASPKSHSPTF